MRHLIKAALNGVIDELIVYLSLWFSTSIPQGLQATLTPLRHDHTTIEKSGIPVKAIRYSVSENAIDWKWLRAPPAMQTPAARFVGARAPLLFNLSS